jgi:hypothetical protein
VFRLIILQPFIIIMSMVNITFPGPGNSSVKRTSFRYCWLLLMIMLFRQNTFSQDKNFYPEDYKSVKAVSLTGGLIGFGPGGEVRADISIGRYMIFGSAGYKGYGARDSMFSDGSRTYQQIIVSDCKGPILNFGVGFRFKRSENTAVEFVANDMYVTEDAFNYYLHYTGRNENLPHLKSKYAMLEISSLPTGVFYNGPGGHWTGGSIFIKGNNVYISAILRSMDEIAPINRATIIDFGPMVSSDFRQAGLMVNIFLINHHFNYSMGFGLIRRFDKPDVVIDPFEGDGAYKWGFPFHFTFGGTFIRQKRSSDFVKKNP